MHTLIRRVERAFSPERWAQVVDLKDVFASPTQNSIVQAYHLPAQRVVVAALHLEVRNAHVSRIRNIVVADAVDTYVNNTGPVRMELQSAIKFLAGDSDSKHLNSVKSWRDAGEWLLDFFQCIPLGAIYMMHEQSIVYAFSATSLSMLSNRRQVGQQHRKGLHRCDHPILPINP